MGSHFASPERADESELATQIEIISQNPLVSGILNTTSGVMAVLNKHRQIVSLNNSFLHYLGIENPGEALGVRPGEVLQCVYADDSPAGCGTGKMCSTCGAAIALVATMDEAMPNERVCALTARRQETTIDLVLQVRAHPIDIDKERFLLIYLEDITLEQHRAALERTFFHDMNNLLFPIVAGSELLADDLRSNNFDTARDIHRAALRLKNEFAIQKMLMQSNNYSYRVRREKLLVREVLDDLHDFIISHPAAGQREIVVLEPVPDVAIESDLALISRTLANMLINALEATEEKGRIKVWVEIDKGECRFCVWNAQEIAEKIQPRIFQRNFTTKEQDGRGLGTFSMKLFGENILGGSVDFISSPEQGTLFTFSLPCSPEG